jgi:hypothetical protein
MWIVALNQKGRPRLEMPCGSADKQTADFRRRVVDEAAREKGDIEVPTKRECLDGRKNPDCFGWEFSQHFRRIVDACWLQTPLQKRASVATRAAAELEDGSAGHKEATDGLKITAIGEAPIEFDRATVSRSRARTRTAEHDLPEQPNV